jgi:hypothetical protein
MSNFQTWQQNTGGNCGFAPRIFTADTVDSAATVTTAGYLNDLANNFQSGPAQAPFKVNDIFFINTSLAGTYPTPTSTLGAFYVTFSASNWSLVAFPALALGALVAANNLSDLTNLSNAQLNTNALYVVETTAAFSDLATAGVKIIQASSGSQQYKVRELRLSGGGTNFSGGGGNRNVAIQDATGSHVYSVIPAATAQALAFTNWGSTGLAAPAVAGTSTQATDAGSNLVIKYSGGTTDYTAGSLTVIATLQRVA